MIDPTPDRRFQRPWRVRESGESFIVEDATGFPVAFVFFQGRKEPRRCLAQDEPVPGRANRLGDRKNWLDPRNLNGGYHLADVVPAALIMASLPPGAISIADATAL